MSNETWIEERVREHLTEELTSGDPKRINEARQASALNSMYGIGSWARNEQTGKIIILNRRPPQSL